MRSSRKGSRDPVNATAVTSKKSSAIPSRMRSQRASVCSFARGRRLLRIWAATRLRVAQEGRECLGIDGGDRYVHLRCAPVAAEPDEEGMDALSRVIIQLSVQIPALFGLHYVVDDNSNQFLQGVQSLLGDQRYDRLTASLAESGNRPSQAGRSSCALGGEPSRSTAAL